MSDPSGEHVLEGVASPPLRNGELDFEAPWQGRVFVMATALSDAGLYPWSEFQAALIERIGAHEAVPGAPYAYYEHFLAALQTLLARKGIVEAAEFDALVLALGQREAGHDHDHHPHHHDHHRSDHGS